MDMFILNRHLDVLLETRDFKKKNGSNFQVCRMWQRTDGCAVETFWLMLGDDQTQQTITLCIINVCVGTSFEKIFVRCP
jgi:hypothetical protein